MARRPSVQERVVCVELSKNAPVDLRVAPWKLTAILAIVSGLIAYGLARGPSPGHPSRAGLAVGALLVAVLAAIAMMYLAGGGEVSPSLYARIAFLCFFVCIAIPVGWVAARI
jgi:hypothetical protein